MTVRLYGTGHLPDPAHVAASLRHVSAIIADDQRAGVALSGRAADHIREVHDQRGTSRCVAEALGQGFACAARAQGYDAPEVSVTALYRMARQGQHPVTDSGSSPSEACYYAMARGLVPESRWPSVWAADGWTQANINDALPLDVWEHALDATITEVGTIDLADRASIDAAIDAGYSIAWSTVVDKQFDAYSGGELAVPQGTNRGRHYTLLVDRAEVPVGVNSWSENWGIAWGVFRGGFYRVSYDRLADSTSTDGRVIRVGPRVLT